MDALRKKLNLKNWMASVASKVLFFVVYTLVWRESHFCRSLTLQQILSRNGWNMQSIHTSSTIYNQHIKCNGK